MGVGSAYGMRSNPIAIIGILVSILILQQLFRSIIFNHTWAFRVYERRIAWSTPYESVEVEADNIKLRTLILWENLIHCFC